MELGSAVKVIDGRSCVSAAGAGAAGGGGGGGCTGVFLPHAAVNTKSADANSHALALPERNGEIRLLLMFLL
jgi:hypothetical protein